MPCSPGERQKAMDKQANLFQGEYLAKARTVDRDYVGVGEGGEIGPVEQRLRNMVTSMALL